MTDIHKIKESFRIFQRPTNLVPKFPKINTKKPTPSIRKNFHHSPLVIYAGRAIDNLSHPTLSGKSIIEWINQKGEKASKFPDWLFWGRKTAADKTDDPKKSFRGRKFLSSIIFWTECKNNPPNKIIPA